MNPEALKKIEELQKQIDSLTAVVNSMQSDNLVSPEFARVLENVNILEDSGKNISSITKSVNEAGAGTYNVAQLPDGFKQIGGLNFWYSN